MLAAAPGTSIPTLSEFTIAKDLLLRNLRVNRVFEVAEKDVLQVGEPNRHRPWDAFPFIVDNVKPGIWTSSVTHSAQEKGPRLTQFEAHWLREGHIDYLNLPTPTPVPTEPNDDDQWDWARAGTFDCEAGDVGIVARSALPPNHIFNRLLETVTLDGGEEEKGTFVWETISLAAEDSNEVEVPIPGGLICNVHEGFHSYPVFVRFEDEEDDIEENPDDDIEEDALTRVDGVKVVFSGPLLENEDEEDSE